MRRLVGGQVCRVGVVRWPRRHTTTEVSSAVEEPSDHRAVPTVDHPLDPGDPERRVIEADHVLRLAHAAVQWCAARAGVRILHLKGPVAAGQFSHRTGVSGDVDVLVAPTGAARLLAVLAEHGWTTYAASSQIGFVHATTLTHPAWTPSVDVHHWFPGLGVDHEAAFEELWARHDEMDLAGLTCAVPARIDHALLLMLHSVRNARASERGQEGALLWGVLDVHERRELSDRATQLGAEAALASRLPGEFSADGPQAAYWQTVGSEPTGLELWLARIRLTPGLGGKLRVLWLAATPKFVGERAGHAEAVARRASGALVPGLRGLPQGCARCGAGGRSWLSGPPWWCGTPTPPGSTRATGSWLRRCRAGRSGSWWARPWRSGDSARSLSTWASCVGAWSRRTLMRLPRLRRH